MRVLITVLVMGGLLMVLSASAQTSALAAIPCSEAAHIIVSNGDDTQIHFINELDRPLLLAPTLNGGDATDPRLRINPGANRTVDTKVGRTWIVFENVQPEDLCIAYFLAQPDAGIARITAELAGLAPNAPRPRERTRTRTTTDQPDDITVAQLHFMYVTPSDGPDNQLDIFGDIEFEIAVIQEWLMGQVGRQFNIDTFNGQPDITFVRLSRNDATVREEGLFTVNSVGTELETRGFNDRNKLYVIFYDGGFNFICGGAGGVGIPAFLYLNGSTTDPRFPNQVFSECGLGFSPLGALNSPALPSGSWASVMVHEVLHGLGFIPSCAPLAEGPHLAGNRNDIMSSTGSVAPVTLDRTRTQYYGHDNDCLDLEDSALWSDAGPGADPIPGK